MNLDVQVLEVMVSEMKTYWLTPLSYDPILVNFSET